MKKTDLINPALSEVIAGLGHTDALVIADAGLPIPQHTRRFDLALVRGVPTFLDTLRVVLSEMHVERAIVSEEVVTFSPHIYAALKKELGQVPIDAVPHQAFKKHTASARAAVRTGEFTPYANVILVAGAWGFGL
jgi:D-ribose pyranase